MGLDTTHDCWHGAYSAFNRWRNKLAEVAGYSIAKVKDEYGITWDEIQVDWGHLQDRLYGDWDETPKDPLLVLIAHSDCEGKIKPKQAKALATRLRELLPLLPDGDGGGHIGDWKEKTQKFIDGLELATKNRQIVRFH